ncbi:Hypothetical protein NTJ_00252 [Nesidiocoris tenuis]|uniref:C2H2-type domain-containing protein n=1 Tax=Nesidiocoris tenuis TaxID=355587 RepID=A0ABN7A5M4_9HEMI|nr:Hypothetical protein NTJ_00252 [Nesidiocoris tenuis]
MYDEQAKVKQEKEEHEEIEKPALQVKNVEFTASQSHCYDKELKIANAGELKPKDEEITANVKIEKEGPVKVELSEDDGIIGSPIPSASGLRKSTRAKQNVDYSLFGDDSGSTRNSRMSSKKGNSMIINPKWMLEKERLEMGERRLSVKVENPEIAESGCADEGIKLEKTDCADEPVESIDILGNGPKIKIEGGIAVDSGWATTGGGQDLPPDGSLTIGVDRELRMEDVQVEGNPECELQEQKFTPCFPPRYGRIKVDPEDLIEGLTSDGEWTGKLAELSSLVNLADPSTLSVTDGRWFLCLVCKYKTHLSSAIVKHIRVHTGEKPYVCTVCDYRCVEGSSLASHMRTHTGEKPYFCTRCDFRSRSSSQIKFHMMAHQGEKPLKCSECGYRCIEPGGMKTHMMTHTGEKPFACNLCDYRGIKGSSLKSHMRVHTGDKPYQCSFCPFVCSNASSLKLHTRTHTGEKPYKCEYCDHQSASASSMKNHEMRHSGLKPFVCPYCPHRARKSCAMKAHVATHTNNGKFVCLFTGCDYRAATAANLRSHAIVHSPDKPYKCHLCFYRGKLDSQLKLHMKHYHRVNVSAPLFNCADCTFHTFCRSLMKEHTAQHFPPTMAFKSESAEARTGESDRVDRMISVG